MSNTVKGLKTKSLHITDTRNSFWWYRGISWSLNLKTTVPLVNDILEQRILKILDWMLPENLFQYSSSKMCPKIRKKKASSQQWVWICSHNFTITSECEDMIHLYTLKCTMETAADCRNWLKKKVNSKQIQILMKRNKHN